MYNKVVRRSPSFLQMLTIIDRDPKIDREPVHFAVSSAALSCAAEWPIHSTLSFFFFFLFTNAVSCWCPLSTLSKSPLSNTEMNLLFAWSLHVILLCYIAGYIAQNQKKGPMSNTKFKIQRTLGACQNCPTEYRRSCRKQRHEKVQQYEMLVDTHNVQMTDDMNERDNRCRRTTRFCRDVVDHSPLFPLQIGETARPNLVACPGHVLGRACSQIGWLCRLSNCHPGPHPDA